MKFQVDEALCAGHGLCAGLAPTVFECDDEGFNIAAGRTVELQPSAEAAAHEGMEACPEQAIQIFD